MTLLTDQILEDGISFLLLIVILASFWFHPWHRMNLVGGRAQTGREKSNGSDIRKKAA